jgi:hypothetical protein
MRHINLVALFITCLALASVICLFAIPHLAKFRPHWNSSWYDLGLYGAYPTQSYFSFDLLSPRVEILQWDARCDQRMTFLTPRGLSVTTPGPVVLDARGNLVWMEQKWGITTNLQVQQYHGNSYLTFWAGIDEVPRGKGSYYMVSNCPSFDTLQLILSQLDSSYEVFREVSAVGDHSDGDLHEFRLTENGTAVVTVYNIIPADLSSLSGPASGWIYDGIIQEIDIATGALIFEWRASEHYQVNDTFLPIGNRGKTSDTAFDFFHINSVDKDPQGNYLISARHTHTVTCVNPTGDILWILGGRANDFTDLSSGAATNFAWQHHARWRSNSTITVFDNAAYDYYLQTAEYSRGMVIDLDLAEMTATLRNSYSKPQQWRSESQGSMQLLSDSGNMLVGWGSAGAYTEFAADGEILCDVHFGAESVFGFGRMSSYRAFKSDWFGKPVTLPDITMVDDTVYVSWNGATEVVTWELQGGKLLGDGGLHFESVDSVRKESFETSLLVPGDEEDYAYLRVAALDFSGQVLGFTDVIDSATGQSTTRPSSQEDQGYSAWLWLFIAGCAIASLVLSVRAFWEPLSALLLHRWQGYKRLSSSEQSWSPGRAASPGIYLAELSTSSSDATVTPTCRAVP